MNYIHQLILVTLEISTIASRRILPETALINSRCFQLSKITYIQQSSWRLLNNSTFNSELYIDQFFFLIIATCIASLIYWIYLEMNIWSVSTKFIPLSFFKHLWPSSMCTVHMSFLEMPVVITCKMNQLRPMGYYQPSEIISHHIISHQIPNQIPYKVLLQLTTIET